MIRIVSIFCYCDILFSIRWTTHLNDPDAWQTQDDSAGQLLYVVGDSAGQPFGQPFGHTERVFDFAASRGEVDDDD